MTVYLVKSFTQIITEGNPTAVVIQGSAPVSSAAMMALARDLEYAETVLVDVSQGASFKLRFFTQTQEVSLCAHATIAAVRLLMELGYIQLSHEELTKIAIGTGVGTLTVRCFSDGFIQMEQADSFFSPYVPDKEVIASLLNISPFEIMDHPLSISSTGVPKLMIPINSLKTLFAIRPNLEEIRKYCQASGARGFYPFTFETLSDDADFHARQFNPLAGIDEDPVTGVAAAALGAYVVKNSLKNKKKFIIEQGYILKKPGKIFVDVNEKIYVGGYAIKFGEKRIEF